MLNAIKKLFFIYSIVLMVGYILGFVAYLDKNLKGYTYVFVGEEVKNINYSWIFLFYIIITSLILIIIAKKMPQNITLILFIIEILLIIISSTFVFYLSYRIFFNQEQAFIGAIIMTLFIISRRLFFKHWRNIIASIFAIAGGIMISLSLSFNLVIIFSILLVLYDIIAVFITKHMITLASIIIKHNMPFVISSDEKIPKRIVAKYNLKQDVARIDLGIGDITVSIMLIVAILAKYGLYLSLMTLIAGLLAFVALTIGLFILKRPLPALPFIVPIMLIPLLVYMLV